MPQLQQGFEIFANWQTVVFCVSIFLATQFVRTLVENASVSKAWAASHWTWRKLLLPFGPIGTGMLLALVAKKFPWPMPLGEAVSSKLMYGAVCGVACAWVYARVREWFGVAADGGNQFAAKVLKRTPSTPPPPNDSQV